MQLGFVIGNMNLMANGMQEDDEFQFRTSDKCEFLMVGLG